MRNSIFVSLMSLILYCFIPYYAYSQAINTLQIIPSNPSPEDSVWVIASVWLPSGECWLEQAGLSVINQDVNVYAGYDAGLLTVICTSVDTIALGRFNPGNYTCNYNLIYPFYTSAIDDVMSVGFTVSGSTSVQNLSGTGLFMKLVHLSDNQYQLNYQLPNGERGMVFEIFDITGRLMYRQQLPAYDQGKENFILPLAHGLNILIIKNNEGKQYCVKFTR
ncbi:MAG: hypothetical protein AB9842_07480 [Bacteroidales bacterium]